MQKDDLLKQAAETTEFTEDPFLSEDNSRLRLGRLLLDKQEKEDIKLTIAKKEQAAKDARVYERDGDLIYVGGFDRHIAPDELKSYLERFGPLKTFEYYANDEREKGRRGPPKMPYLFIAY